MVKTGATRMFVRGTFVGFQRGKVNQYEKCALLKIEGVDSRKDVDYYLGKRVAFVNKDGSRTNLVWGKVTRPHGNGGVVRAHFRKNLCPQWMGQPVRVMLFPSHD
eukprot:gnl/Dysnectes_brevis/70_a87_16428.p1 GENE.gnl/Dysnectes_brevis/70_a87_16428~~gnl/Dysnectes_brevis/70_a87_16428.p1  ORF type:complete len:112 (-),score=18.18 gnl/Dysnectes_brevis/70_a87_16428:104-418(-)